MNIDHHSWCADPCDRQVVYPIALGILRLILTIVVALVVVGGLLHELSMVGRQTRAISPVAFCNMVTTGSTRCSRPTLAVTKTVDPSNPEIGSIVTISFIISGLGLKRGDVVLVQDVSGSMNNESRLEDSKAAAIAFVNETQAADRIAVVAYSNTARLAQPLTTDKYAVTTTINALTAGGNTNIGDGIREGYRELISSTNYASDTVKAMILLSDGQANRPQPDAEQYARDQAQMTADCGIPIHTIGFGSANKELMQDIATVTGGRYHFAPDSTELITIYKEIAIELRDMVIIDILPPGVSPDCDLLPGDWGCTEGTNGFMTITYQFGNQWLITDPLILSFTATVSLSPDFETQLINAPGSCVYYDGPDSSDCQPFENPPVCMRPYPADAYESDDDWVENWIVPLVSPGERLQRNFSHSGDKDWVKAVAESDKIYTFTTAAVSADVGDRVLEFYTTSGPELILLASGINSLVWPTSTPTPTPTPAPARSILLPLMFKNNCPTSASEHGRLSAIILDVPDYYYLRISSLDDRFGCGTQYELSVER